MKNYKKLEFEKGKFMKLEMSKEMRKGNFIIRKEKIAPKRLNSMITILKKAFFEKTSLLDSENNSLSMSK